MGMDVWIWIQAPPLFSWITVRALRLGLLEQIPENVGFLISQGNIRSAIDQSQRGYSREEKNGVLFNTDSINRCD
jgi:hypothetical protein